MMTKFGVIVIFVRRSVETFPPSNLEPILQLHLVAGKGADNPLEFGHFDPHSHWNSPPELARL